jgi:hypothetical protein
MSAPHIVCSYCKHSNNSSSLRCLGCNRILPRSSARAAPSTPPPSTPPPTTSPIPFGATPTHTPAPIPASASAHTHSRPDLAGTVENVSSAQMRKPSDWTRTALNWIWALITLPFRFQRALNGPHFGNRYPIPEFQEVTVLRVKDATGKSVQARLEGELLGAVAELGDEVELWGHYRGGLLIVSRGYNDSTKAEIRLNKGLDIGKLFRILVIITFFILVIQLWSWLT